MLMFGVFFIVKMRDFFFNSPGIQMGLGNYECHIPEKQQQQQQAHRSCLRLFLVL